MANILAVDDDEDILALIRNALRREGHEVTTVSGADKLDRSRLNWYDLILLDVMMPGQDGFALCSELRELVDCPILFLTAKTLEDEVKLGLSLGADDYIRKPFSLVELRARVAAHLRREEREKRSCLAASGVRFFLKQGEAYAGKTRIPFTKSEYLICEALAKRRGQVFTKEAIYEQVFGCEGESDVSAITEHIKNIRRKLSENGLNPVKTVWGIGYKWE